MRNKIMSIILYLSEKQSFQFQNKLIEVTGTFKSEDADLMKENYLKHVLKPIKRSYRNAELKKYGMFSFFFLTHAFY